MLTLATDVASRFSADFCRAGTARTAERGEAGGMNGGGAELLAASPMDFDE